MQRQVSRRDFACRSLFAIAGALRADEGPLFRSHVTLVKAETYVYDRQTKAPVRGLTAQDFVVFDGEQRRLIAHFANDTGPLDLLMLLDVSGSMREVLPKVRLRRIRLSRPCRSAIVQRSWPSAPGTRWCSR